MEYRFPTTNIFYYRINDRLGVLKWLPTEAENPIRPANVPAEFEATIYSSCEGLVACRCNATSTYHVGNPYVSDTAGNRMIRYRDLPAPPTRHRPLASTHVVLAVDPFTTGFLVYCACRCKHNDDYMFQTFDSISNRWYSSITQLDGLNIVANSGVSFRKAAYWLLSDATGSPVYVLRFNACSPSAAGALTKMALPNHVPGPRRTQLGRAWDGIGMGLVAVVVYEASYTVELYALIDPEANPWWHRFESFRVEVPTAGDAAEDGGGWIASWRQEDRTLVCRELPWPIRFDSLRVELLFWVRGRVLLLQNWRADLHRYRLTVLPGIRPPAIIHGVPHVSTALLPRDL